MGEIAKCPACGTENLDAHKHCLECGTNLSGATGQLSQDTILENRYVIAKTIGRGGMGAVYLALDTHLKNKPVAIKEMSSSALGQGNLEGAIAAFEKEASMLISLRHSALPHIYDFFSRDNDRWYLVMEYIDGETLQDIADRRGPIPEPEVLNWASQLCEILDYLHSQEPPVIFRDLKPSNIMVTGKNEIKLIDFGIARHFQEGNPTDTSAYGSKGFSPPEQYGQNQTDARSDIYALGATLHSLLTGKDPTKSALFQFDPPSNSVSVSDSTNNAVMRALENRPDKRPASAHEMLGMLNGDTGDLNAKRYLKQAPINEPTAEIAIEQTVQPRDKTDKPNQTLTKPINRDKQPENRDVTTAITSGPQEFKPDKKAKPRTAVIISAIIVLLAMSAGYVFYSNREAEKQSLYETYLQKGSAAFEKKQYSDAESYFTKAMDLYPEREVYINMARTYLAENNNKKAIEYLQDKVDKGLITSDIEVKYLLGTAYYNLGDYQMAVFYLRDAVKSEQKGLANEYIPAQRDLAVAYAKEGEYERSREILNQIKDKSSQKPIVDYISGELALIQHNYSTAQKNFESALKADSGNIRYKISLADFYLAKNKQGISENEKISNYNKAITLLTEVEADDPYNILVLNDLGQAYFDFGTVNEGVHNVKAKQMYKEALIRFNKIIDMNVEEPNMYLNRGILHEKLGQQDAAASDYQKALSLDENGSRANLIYGLFQLKRKNYSDAYCYLNKTVEVNQNAAEALTAQEKIDELKQKGWID